MHEWNKLMDKIILLFLPSIPAFKGGQVPGITRKAEAAVERILFLSSSCSFSSRLWTVYHLVILYHNKPSGFMTQSPSCWGSALPSDGFLSKSVDPWDVTSTLEHCPFPN